MHQSISTLLQNYHPADQWEKICKKYMLRFLSKDPDCFERSNEFGHFTSSAWLLDRDATHALLMYHTKLNEWLQPGGHCDGDPNMLAVAIKEAQEESGIKNIVPINTDIFDIDLHDIPENLYHKEHIHFDIRFLLRAASEESLVQNHESQELRWVGKNRIELPTTNASILRMFDKWLALSQ